MSGDEDLIAANYRERGLEPPDHIEKPPAPDPHSLMYWTAYADLQHERPPNLYDKENNPIRQRIPWSSIARYARYHGMNVDELKRVVWACDSEFIGDLSPEPEDKGDG